MNTKQYPKRFTNAIDRLVKAFFNGTLKKGNCVACAVGNICASSAWANLFMTVIDVKAQEAKQVEAGPFEILVLNSISGVGKVPIMSKNDFYFKNRIEAEKIVRSTGYSQQDLMKVEWAFESNTQILYEDYDNVNKEEIMEDQYNGLMAVVDVLCEIEDIGNPLPIKKEFSYI